MIRYIRKRADRHFKELCNPFHVLQWVEVFAVFFIIDSGLSGGRT